jgi:hypothetical protein
MHKKLRQISLMLAFSFLISLIPVINASAIDSNSQEYSAFSVHAISPQIDQSTVVEGYVKIAYTNENTSKMKVLVEKDSNKYNYDFDGKGKYENYPLNMGDGEYNIYLLENTEGRNYMIIDEWNITAKINTGNTLYTISNKIVNFENSNAIIEKTKELTKELKSDEDKAKSIYNYIINNVKYDLKKQKTVTTGYVPNIQEVMNSKSGICYDFAAVYAGMLRSVGIPTKLVMGTSKNVKGYHAWNEVFINQKWVIVDTSYDSQANQLKAVVNMYKVSGDYNKDKQY